VISLTDNAASAVRTAISKSASPVTGLRILVEAGGCAGMKYTIGLVAEPKPEDVIVQQEDLKLFVDPSSAPLLAGTVVDFVTSLDGSGFTFSNPKAQESCSCGKSFR